MKRKFVKHFIISCILICMIPTFAFATTYESEPNNSKSQADSIELETVRGRISHPSDVDVFKLSLSEESRLSITLTNIPDGCNYDLYVYKDGKLIEYSANSGNKNEVINNLREDGTIYFYVVTDGSYSSSYYKLTVMPY